MDFLQFNWRFSGMSKVPKVERSEFEDVVRNLLHQQPMKRSAVKVDAKKPRTVIQPHHSEKPHQ